MKRALTLLVLVVTTTHATAALLVNQNCVISDTQPSTHTISCAQPSLAYYPNTHDPVASVPLGTADQCQQTRNQETGSQWYCTFKGIHAYCIIDANLGLCTASISNKRHPNLTDSPNLVNGKIESKNKNIPTHHSRGMF